MSGHKPVPAVVAALRILRRLGAADEARTLTEIARDCGLNTSTCFNILRTLAAERIVAFHPASKRYAIGADALDLARKVLAGADPWVAMRAPLARLARKHGLTVVLWQTTADDELHAVAHAESDRHLRIHMVPGQRIPMLSGAAGRCVAAHAGLPRDELQRRFQALAWQRPLSFALYLKQVADARRLGHGIDDGYRTSGVQALAAPILGRDGRAAYCVSAIMFHGQFADRRLREIAADTRALAAGLGRLLGPGRA